MKTNIILQSKDRNLFGVIVKQETKTGFLNLSDLQEAYTRERIKNGWVEKNITMILTNKDNLQVIYYLLEKQGVIKLSLLSFMECVESQGFAKYMKSLNCYKTTGARHTKTTWVDPYIWVMIAMDLNPLFKAHVIGWLTDELVINRIEAGNFYKALSLSVSKFNPNGTQYATLAKALNHIVFNRHELGIRNSATAKELKQIEELEKKMSFAIDMGYITSFDMLLSELRKVYHLNNG